MTNLISRMGALAVVVCASSGCGLISSDVTNFDLTLPDKAFTIDATGWQVDQTQADLLLGTSCAGTPQLCSAAAEMACKMGCTGSCNPTTNKCALELEVSLYQPIDLVMEKPELKSINDEPLIKVTIDAITYDVTTNTLNTATPEMTLYVSPMSIMDPMDPAAKPIGTIASVPVGFVTTAPLNIVYTPTGKADLVAMMNNYKTPFNVIVGSTLTVQQGTPVPTGKLDAVVHIKAHAGI